MSSQNYKIGHDDNCPASFAFYKRYGENGGCTCGLDAALAEAHKRQEMQDETARNWRDEIEAAEWRALFRVILPAVITSAGVPITGIDADRDTYAEIVRRAAQLADAAIGEVRRRG